MRASSMKKNKQRNYALDNNIYACIYDLDLGQK